MSAFLKDLETATDENKEVNSAYKDEFTRQFNKLKDNKGNQLIRFDKHKVFINRTDGVFDCEFYECKNDAFEAYVQFFMLMECKLNEDFNNPKEKAKVLVQAIAYLAQLHYCKFGNNEKQKRLANKKIKLKEDYLKGITRMPTILFVGSKNSCFAINTRYLQNYYMSGIDINDLSAASKFIDTESGRSIYDRVYNDKEISTVSPVFKTSDKGCMEYMANIIYRLNQHADNADDLTPANIYVAFKIFTTRVLTAETVERLTNRQQASLLAQFIVDRKSIKKETNLDGAVEALIVNNLHVEVNSEEWTAFSWLYNLKTYSDDEQKKITAITDQLIEEDDRRRKGDYYTPAIWVEEAHKLLDRNLEEGWRDKYMVWDCAWGTGNLTRDCTKLNGTYIKDLYCSTLHETDLEIGARYNRNAVKFQYDFLNDDVKEMEQIKNCCKLGQYDTANAILFNTKLYKQAPGLIDSLLGINGKKKKKLMFLINPPYGTSKTGKIDRDNSSKEGIAKNSVNDLAVDDDLGLASRQLYALFIYRIMIIQDLFKCDTKIAAFTQSDFMSTVAYKNFRTKLYNKAKYIDGFIIRGNEFQAVSKDIAISFTLFDFEKGKTDNTIVNVLERDIEGKVINIGKHNVHAAEKLFNKTIRAGIPTRYKDKKSMVPMMSALNIREDAKVCQVQNNCIGGFQCNGNAINYNDQYVALYSSPFHGAANMNILDTNLDDVLTLFTARRLISGKAKTWYAWKDEYENPNKTDKRYKQFEIDAIIYSLFESKSQQSSLRNVYYAGKNWNIQNEFFWMSVKEIAELAQGKIDPADVNQEVCDDIEEFGDNRFVYKKLQTVTLSPDAQLVLDTATELVRKSFKHRKEFNQKHPEYHINTWDAGWYQIKGLCKEYPALKTDLDNFNKLYKQFEDRMRPLVYELGFLYK